jgi:AcrR family transcriptional regulator
MRSQPSVKPKSRTKSKPKQRKKITSDASSREQQKAETRQALIEAGVRLIAEHGLDVPSLDAICERAGYTRGAFYVHFADRDEFIVAVMDHLGQRVLNLLPASNEPAWDLTLAARLFVGAVRSKTYPLTPGGGVQFHQLLDACARSARVKGRYVELAEESIRRLRASADAGKKAGSIDGKLDDDVLARVVLSIVLGVQVMLEVGIEFDLQRAIASMLQVIAPHDSRA